MSGDGDSRVMVVHCCLAAQELLGLGSDKLDAYIRLGSHDVSSALIGAGHRTRF
jgi:hypothetical protein